MALRLLGADVAGSGRGGEARREAEKATTGGPSRPLSTPAKAKADGEKAWSGGESSGGVFPGRGDGGRLARSGCSSNGDARSGSASGALLGGGAAAARGGASGACGGAAGGAAGGATSDRLGG